VEPLFFLTSFRYFDGAEKTFHRQIDDMGEALNVMRLAVPDHSVILQQFRQLFYHGNVAGSAVGRDAKKLGMEVELMQYLVDMPYEVTAGVNSWQVTKTE
jgi:hypothetical protein